jgi:VWFA-related protein
MKTKRYSLVGIGAFALLGIVFLPFWLTADSNSQENQISHRDESQLTSDSRTQISAKEIRIDAVVLDRKGRQIVDLTADDFEIYQDEQKQKVNLCTYINYDQIRPDVRSFGMSPESRTVATVFESQPHNDMRRRIVLFVDNYSMNSAQLYRAQQVLKRFVETQMQAEDLIAIMETLHGNAAHLSFSSDKQLLLLAIGKLQSAMDLRTIDNSGSAMSLLRQCILALKATAGRKSLIAISAEAMLLGSSSGSMGSFVISPSSMENKRYPSNYYVLADAAFRAGVVIHLLDVSGLSGFDASDGVFTAERGSGRVSPEEKAKIASRAVAKRNAQAQAALANKTGGLFIRDSNLSANGNASLKELLKGYYILTYTPSPETFVIPHEIDISNLPYHKIKINAKRPSAEVLTRDGFFAVTERENTVTEK